MCVVGRLLSGSTSWTYENEVDYCMIHGNEVDYCMIHVHGNEVDYCMIHGNEVDY